MTTSARLFHGLQPTRLDSSRRFYVPADWLRSKGELLYLIYSQDDGHPVIKVLTRSVYDEKMFTIMEQDVHDKTSLKTQLEKPAREVRPDSRNRIVIPSDLSDMLGLEAPGKVILAGFGDHFQIWQTEEFESFMGQFLDDN